MLACTSAAAARASCWKRSDVGAVAGQRRLQHLQRHLPAERLLLGEIDLGHAAGAEAPQDAIVAQLAAGQIAVGCGVNAHGDFRC